MEEAKAEAASRPSGRFENLLAFLTIRKKAAGRLQRMHKKNVTDTPKPKEIKPRGKAKKEESKAKPEKSDDENAAWQTVNRKSPPRGRRASSKEKEAAECSLCENQKHWLRECPVFKEMSREDRHKYCEERALCYKCMRFAHDPKNCKYVHACLRCGENHNTMLHDAKYLPAEAHEKVVKTEI